MLPRGLTGSSRPLASAAGLTTGFPVVTSGGQALISLLLSLGLLAP
jgi:hypothetical protein